MIALRTAANPGSRIVVVHLLCPSYVRSAVRFPSALDRRLPSASGSLKSFLRRNPLLKTRRNELARLHRASRATVFRIGGINLSRRLPEEAVPNVVYFLHQAPTTSVPLNQLGARGWQGIPNPL